MTKRYCMGCMSPMEGEGTVCSICSHDNEIDNPRGTLPAGTVLEEKYLVGKTLSQNDLTVVYIGLDLERGRRVYVEEFMPRAYADRSADGITVAAAGENQAQFKTLLSDIKERWRSVSGIENKSLIKARELLLVNNTAVSVTSYVAYVTLEQYLEKKGPLEWDQAKGLFMPLASLVSILHNRGIIHYGVSPENVVVDRRGGLRLIGFALPELRTVGKGLSPQLYDGYSAPEQYARGQWQGEWCDIYAVGALLYRALTGLEPVPATQRARADTLVKVKELRPEVPDYVSDAIAKAMELDRKNRHPSMDDFTAALLAEAGSNTTVFRPEPPVRERPVEEEPVEKGPSFSGINFLMSAVLAVSLVLNIVLAASYFSPQPPQPPSSSEPEEEENVPATAPTAMENLVGEYWPMLEERLDSYPGIAFETEEVFDEEVPAGVIIGQSLPEGTTLPEEGRVTLTVSKGSQFVTMPRLEGCTLSAAQYMLDSLGLTWDEDIREDPTLNVPVGTVVCDTPPNSKVTAGYKVRLTIRTADITAPESSSAVE